MNKIKIGLIVGAILIIAGTFVTVNIQAKKIRWLNSEKNRLTINNYQLMAEKRQETNLFLREKELTGKLSTERDSIAKALQIKPKQITQIKYQVEIVRDTIDRPVPVFIQGQNFWKIKDVDKCFTWEADAFLQSDSLNIKRTLFDYHNKMTEVYYRKRPHKFLFIRYGKFQNLKKISQDCGEIEIKSFNFVK